MRLEYINSKNMWCVGTILLVFSSGSLAVVNENKPPLLKLSVRPRADAFLDNLYQSIFPMDNNIISDLNQLQRQENKDPCGSYIPPKLRFRNDALRISDRKCTEYISEMVNREIIIEREEKCKRGKLRGNSLITISKRYSTKRGEYPHMAAIGWKMKEKNSVIFLCGGTLISPNFVLTAAHCSSQTGNSLVRAKPEIVRLGTRNTQRYSDAMTDVKIKRFIHHPRWNPPLKYYDIALIELTTTVRFSKFIQPACLSGQYSGEYNATITGWGITEKTSKTLSSVLQAAEVDIIDSEVCNSLLKIFQSRNWYGVEEHQICAGKIEGGVDTCLGDSGGPLQVKLQQTRDEGTMHMVIGVTSFGFGCGVKGKPGIYTRVSSFLDWIESIVWQNI